MELVINDSCRISTDRYNWIVEERKVAGKDSPEPGKEYWVNVSYHNTLENACTWLMNNHARESELTNVFGIVGELHRLSHEINQAIDRTQLKLA